MLSLPSSPCFLYKFLWFQFSPYISSSVLFLLLIQGFREVFQQQLQIEMENKHVHFSGVKSRVSIATFYLRIQSQPQLFYSVFWIFFSNIKDGRDDIIWDALGLIYCEIFSIIYMLKQWFGLLGSIFFFFFYQTERDKDDEKGKNLPK